MAEADERLQPLLHVRQDGADWKLDCEYAGAVQTLTL